MPHQSKHVADLLVLEDPNVDIFADSIPSISPSFLPTEEIFFKSVSQQTLSQSQ